MPTVGVTIKTAIYIFNLFHYIVQIIQTTVKLCHSVSC